MLPINLNEAAGLQPKPTVEEKRKNYSNFDGNLSKVLSLYTLSLAGEKEAYTQCRNLVNKKQKGETLALLWIFFQK